MQDRQPGKPGQYKATLTAAEFQKMQAGQQFTITMIRDDQPIVEGTPYSKAAVLPDAVANAICPDIDNPTPADAFRALQSKKAPAGYGLGKSENVTSVGGLDACIAPGWYHISQSQTIAGITSTYWFVHVIAYGNGSVHSMQEIFPASSAHTKIIRYRLNAVWQEPEVENPPMMPGVEYRTTERLNGKPVYCQLVNLGAMPNATTETLSVYDTYAESVLPPFGNLSDGRAIPYESSNPNLGSVRVFVNKPTEAGTIPVWVESTTDLSAYTANVQLRYTKTTD